MNIFKPGYFFIFAGLKAGFWGKSVDFRQKNQVSRSDDDLPGLMLRPAGSQFLGRVFIWQPATSN
jgi:hypothetical protein